MSFPTVQSINGKLNTTRRWHPEKDLTPLKQDLATAQILEQINRSMANAPALSQHHIDIITTALANN